jgi:hypothetical protein
MNMALRRRNGSTSERAKLARRLQYGRVGARDADKSEMSARIVRLTVCCGCPRAHEVAEGVKCSSFEICFAAPVERHVPIPSLLRPPQDFVPFAGRLRLAASVTPSMSVSGGRDPASPNIPQRGRAHLHFEKIAVSRFGT